MKKENYLEKLRIKGKLKIYMAGLPGFARPFTRDSIISALLLNDITFLHDFLIYASLNQGKRKNKFNGEEPGKIFHEIPGAIIRGLSAEYNACDTNALFLIGFEQYVKKTKDWNFVRKHKKQIKKAISYILNHMKGDYFVEDPKFCGAKRFALRNTYWKDSIIIDRKNHEPEFPVCYTLAHIQNMAGLRAACYLLNDIKLLEKADEMKSKLKNLFDKKTGFIIAKDKIGKIAAISSDALHSLFYLEKEDITKEMLDIIEKSSRKIETAIGYRTLEPRKAKSPDPYHTRTVWPFEQTMIHAGAKKFGLKRVMKVAKRIIKKLGTPYEIFIIKRGKFIGSGACPQLWTIASKEYFKRIK